MKNYNSFHDGELEVQCLTGVALAASKMSGMVQKVILPAALSFIQQQSIIWIGIEDHKDNLWAFPLLGSPGFINPTDGELIDIDLSKTFSIPHEWLKYLKKGKSIGCLVIELSSRRRIRVNGTITKINETQLQIEVQQSFPNCPKYIRRRKIAGSAELSQLHLDSYGRTLNEKLENIIRQSDTAFVSSSGPNGIDMSHRGGETGFIKSEMQNKIIMPDYQGNNMFSTLGNFKINPVAGLIIIDFKEGYFLQITGQINLFINKIHPKLTTGGTDRYWELLIHQWQLFKLDNSFRWESYDFSPFNP